MNSFLGVENAIKYDLKSADLVWINDMIQKMRERSVSIFKKW